MKNNDTGRLGKHLIYRFNLKLEYHEYRFFLLFSGPNLPPGQPRIPAPLHAEPGEDAEDQHHGHHQHAGLGQVPSKISICINSNAIHHPLLDGSRPASCSPPAPRCTATRKSVHRYTQNLNLKNQNTN
jgi:hypothetical protein